MVKKYNYAVIDDERRKIYVSQERITSISLIKNTSLKNVILIENDTEPLKILGDEERFTFNWRSNWDEKVINEVEPHNLEEGYRNIWDWVKRKKSKYVPTGWVSLKETMPFEAKMKDFYIIYR